MKTLILKFKHVDGRGILHPNQCNVQVKEAAKDEPAHVTKISFKDPVKNISYSEFTELFHNIQVALDEENTTASVELTIGDVTPGNLPTTKAGIFGAFFEAIKKDGLKGGLEFASKVGQAANENGEMTQEEIQKSNKVLNSFNDLLNTSEKNNTKKLGPKKK